jgi:putative FmdB family regulatory protein
MGGMGSIEYVIEYVIVGKRHGGGFQMPTYEYRCKACRRSFSVIQTIAQHEKGKPACPKCKKKKDVKQLISTFSAQTSRKS